MRKEFSYIIKLVVQDTMDGSLFYINKEFKNSIEIGENDYYVPFAISQSSANAEMKKELEAYAAENGLDVSTFQIIHKEVTSNDNGIDVYFSDDEEDNIHTYEPDVNVEFIPTVFKPQTPQFFTGHMNDDQSILWLWEPVNGCAYRIIDASGEVVANVGVGSSRYVEEGVKEGNTYIRRIIAYNADGDSEPSEYVVITAASEETTQDNIKEVIEPQDYTSDDIKEIKYDEKSTRYFKSGVGDGLDLLVEKTDEAIFSEKFSVDTIIEAMNNVEQRLYTPIEVEYFIRAMGEEVVYGDPDSEFKLRIVPWPVEEVIFTVNSIISDDISFEVEYDLCVYYQARRTSDVSIELAGIKTTPNELPINEEIHIVLKDSFGDIPDTDVTFATTNQNATITSDGMLIATSTGEVEVTVNYKYYNAAITRKFLFSDSAPSVNTSKENPFALDYLYPPAIINGYRLAKKTIPYKKKFTINGIKHNERLAELIPYARNYDNDILSSPSDTVSIVSAELLYASNDDIKTNIEDNFINVTTTQNEKIYVYKKTYRQKISIDQKNSTNLINLDKITYKNKHNMLYQGNKMPETVIEYIKVPDGIKIYDGDGILFPTKIVDKYPELHATIDIPSLNALISGVTNNSSQSVRFNLADMFNGNNLTAEEYVLEIVGLYIDGDVTYSTSDSSLVTSMDGNKLVYVKNINGAYLEVKGVPTKEYVPFTKESDPVTCIVNGKTPYIYDYDGKNNYVEFAPVFTYEHETRNVEYEAVVFSKAEKRIDATFENGHKYRGTKRNGDILIISSGDYETVSAFRKQVVSQSTSEELTLEQHAQDFTIYIYNPRFNKSAEFAELNACDVNLKSSNPNIAITSDVKTIDFTNPNIRDEIRIPITVTATIISESQKSWSPTINSGYYYINNKEYYLYGENNLTGTFGKEVQPVTKYFFASVIANIESKTNSLPITRLLSGQTSFSSGEFINTKLEDGVLTLDSYMYGGKKIYKDEGTYITDDIILGSELDNIEVRVNAEYLDNVKTFVSTNNGVFWSDWVEVGQGYKLQSDQYIQKFKIKLELRRLIDTDIDYSESTSVSSVGDFKADGHSATNLIIQNGLMTQEDVSKVGIYESPICNVVEDSAYVFIEPVSLSVVNGKYEIYIMLSKTKDFSNLEYVRMTDRVLVGDNMYYKYKIILPVNSKIGINEIKTVTSYTSTSQVSVSPIIKSIETSSIPKEWTFAGTIKKPLLCEIKCDNKWKYVTNHNILDMIYPDIAIAGIRHPRVQDIVVEVIDSDIEVKYDLKKDGRISARTKTLKTEIVDSKYLMLDTKHFGFITPVPKLGAPVILMHEDTPLTPVISFDEHGDLTDIITEIKKFKNKDSLVMMYNDIDVSTVNVYCGERDVNVKKVINNTIIIDTTDLTYNDELKVCYKVKNSFCCDLQFDNEKAQVVVYLDQLATPDDYNKITAYCETSDTGLYKASEIEINPMYNINNTGFIYMSEDKQVETNIEVIIDKTSFKATVPEDVYFTVRITDDAGNPIPYLPIRVTTLYGKVKMINNITNKFGIISAKYIHPIFECNDVITASIGDSSVVDNVNITVDRDYKSLSIVTTVKDSKYIVNDGETIVINAKLFEDDLTPLDTKEIVVEIKTSNSVITKNALTDQFGECSFEVTPIVNAENNTCEIEVSYLNIVSSIAVKVVDRE